VKSIEIQGKSAGDEEFSEGAAAFRSFAQNGTDNAFSYANRVNTDNKVKIQWMLQ
jgi:hypothetical protein